MKIILIALMSIGCFGKVKYVYKKYEKFDFDSIDVVGNLSSPGDLSVNSRLKRKFKNKLPRKPNFNKEMLKNIDIL